MSRPLNSNALITADDWGMSPGINDGILALAKKGIIRRVSCMANGQYLGHRIDELRSLPGIELGLHFDLTYGKSQKERKELVLLSFFAPSKIQTVVVTAFREQWSKLQNAGLDPSYLDGHHHIHLFPGVLRAVLSEAKYAGAKYIRTVYDPFLFFSLKFPLVFLSLLARPQIRAAGLATLPCWYPKVERIGLLRFRNRLRSLKHPTEVIVHPSNKNDFAGLSIKDPYAEARIGEYKILDAVF